MDIIERLKRFEKHQMELNDEYGAEVLYRAAETITSQTKKIKRFRKALLELDRKLEWSINAGFDHINYLLDETEYVELP